MTGQSLFFKLVCAAAALGAAGQAMAGDTTRVIVSFKPGSASAIRSAVGAAHGSVKQEIYGINAVAVEVPVQALNGLARNPNVEYIEDDVLRYPFSGATQSTGTPYQLGQLVPWGIKAVQADQLSDASTGNRTVCIIDSGYDRTHEDLSGNIVTGGYDSGTGWWYTDENHHGTHVAGTIAAINNSGVGVVGVNPNRKLNIYIVKVFGAAGWAYSSTLASAANQCGAASANVISMSLGGSLPNKTEQRVFDALQANGVLSVAAAGNAGNRTQSYPAGYDSVLSVAAVDETLTWASFSQYNNKVELAGPGVNVLSTVPMGAGQAASLVVGASTYAPGSMEGSPNASATGALADFGLGSTINSAMAGKVCLIARGSIDFATKVSNCQSSGGVGAVIYNNVAGGFTGTLGTTVTTIPSVTASDTEGAAMKGQLGAAATVTEAAANYAYYDGTSMATPHVSAVAALVWSYFPTCSGTQIRTSLDKSARDLNAPGRDVYTGYGLVQAKAAYDRIKSLGCGK